MTTRLFLVQGVQPPGIKAIEPMEVLDFNPSTHRLHARRADGSDFIDPNFWPMIAKRVGLTITQDIPPQFQ